MTVVRGAAGVLLAGGLASRLGGGDKPLRLIGGRPIIDAVLDRLRPQVDPLAISANGDPARFAAYGLPVLPDNGPRGQIGPLAGVLSALIWAADTGTERVLTVAGDTPFLPKDLVSRLSEAAGTPADRIAVASSAGRIHPVFALWPVSLASDLRLFLTESKTFSVAAFQKRHPSVSVDFPLSTAESPTDPFFNINTPDDLAKANDLAKGLAP
ncbi:MAG: molybdenum cofactor guanylyltransferase MobA [Mesorhizobium sp.]|nr:molybdenum cofactor guanylyltransferase MobA [Mesorhizobium sp.]MBL8578534.1 molybdenum cofactor guanylyltransferase MobA [Mesorhizobium sp.]